MKSLIPSSCSKMALAALLLTAQSVVAELHVYEGFDYPASPELAGLAGGLGWENAWDFLAYESPIVEESLLYQDEQGNTLNSSGGKLFNIGNPNANDSSQPGRTMARHFGEDGSSLWLAFLGQRVGQRNGTDAEDGGPTFVRGANIALFDTTTQGLGQAFPGQERLDIGENSNIANDAWMLRAPATADPHPATTTVTEISDHPIETLSLIVLRFDFVANTEAAPANDRLYMWVNPALGVEPSEAEATLTILDQKEFAFDRLRFFAGGNNGNNAAEWYVDEIRLGDTFGDVTPFTPAVVGEPHLFVPASTPFGALPLGAGVETRTLTLTNFAKTTDLTIDAAIVSGPDAIHYAITGEFPITVAPGSTAEIEITFDTKGRDGEFAASLALTSNDENEPVRLLSLGASVPDPNQLIAWYKMDDTDGSSLSDSSGNGHHGTILGNAQVGVAALASGTAVHFANDAYAEIDRFPPMEAFTLSLWIHGDAPMATPAGLIAKGEVSGDPYALGLNAHLVIWFGAGNTDFAGNDATALVPNATFHLASVFDPNDGSPKVRLYVNGILAHTIEAPTAFSDRTGILQIGAAGSFFPFHGVIDDVQIYGKALTADEITQLHANPGSKLGMMDGELGGPGETTPLVIQQVTLSNGTLNLTYPSETGAVYELQSSNDLKTWSPVKEVTADANTTTSTTAEQADGLASQFFRIARK